MLQLFNVYFTPRFLLFLLKFVLYRAFINQFSISTVTCGGEITKNEGLLVSPNYPRFYPDQQTCVWRITVGDGFFISVTFDYFRVCGYFLYSPHCLSDYLEFRDGLNDTSPFLSRHCGNRIPGVVNSTTNHLYVKFVSDYSVNLYGFSASFAR
ncbi:unnamed protein product, partial [Candidula unifasciata]